MTEERNHETNEATLRAFETIIESNRGDATPVESFIEDLVLSYRAKAGALTPADVDNAVAEFRRNFQDAIQDAQRFARIYPGLIASANVTAEVTVEQ